MKSSMEIKPSDEEGYSICKFRVILNNGMRLQGGFMFKSNASFFDVSNVLGENIRNLLELVEKGIGYSEEEVKMLYPKNEVC